MREANRKRIRIFSILLSVLMMQGTAQPAFISAYDADSSLINLADNTGIVIKFQDISTEGSTGAVVKAVFENTYSDLTRIASAGVKINGSVLNYNSNYNYISSAEIGDCVVSQNTIQFYTASLAEGENVIVFTAPDGENVSVKLKMSKVDDGWGRNSYTIELLDNNSPAASQEEFAIDIESVAADENNSVYTIVNFNHEYSEVTKIAAAGLTINGTKLNYNRNYSSLYYVSNDNDFIVTGSTIQFKTKLLNEGENTIVFSAPDNGEDKVLRLNMTKTEVPPKYWYESTSYEYNVEVIKDDAPATEPVDEENQLYVRLVGSFDNKIINQKDDIDAVSSATTGGSSYISSSSSAQVQYALVAKDTVPGDEDWQKPDYFKNGDQLKINGAESKIIISPECKGVYGEINPFSGDIFLRGVPKQTGNFKVSVYLSTDKGNVTSNELSFNVYSGEEKLIDRLTYDNCKQTADGKYMFDNEPWYITEFGGKKETVTVPKDIKAWYGSHAALPEANYGELGRIASRNDEGVVAEPSQTLIIPSGCNLTMVNMKLHSDVKIIVQEGAKLTLRQTTVDGVIEVNAGGTFSMDYNDYGGGEWLHGSMINGQLRMRDGSVLENARITAHGNYLAEYDDDTRRNFEPVVVTEGNVSIKGNVYILGEEAPTGETGQPALKVNGTLNVPENSTLACYGGGVSYLTSNGGTAIILNNGKITGEGNVIAIGGYGMNITGDASRGCGGTAVSGNGDISVKNAYLEGGATFHDKAASAIDSSVKISDETNRKLVSGKTNTTDKSEFYWFGTGDSNGIIPQIEKTLEQVPQDSNVRKVNNTDTKKDFTVTIYNGESDTPKIVECSESKIIKNIAEKVDGKNFAYWTLDGTVFSYNSKIAYRADNTGILKAVYTKDAVEASGTANIRKAKYSALERKLTFNAYLTVPDNCKIVSAGLVSASDKNFDPANGELTAENADYSKSLAAAVGKSVPVSYTWNKSNVNLNDVWYVRAHIVYTDSEGNMHDIYGNLITVTAGCDYDSSEKGTALIRSAVYNASEKKATFNSYLTVPEEGVIVKAGLVAASSNNFDKNKEVLTSENADYTKSLASAAGKSVPVSYTWNKSNVYPGDIWYARAYLVYTIDGIEHTVYGSLTEIKA